MKRIETNWWERKKLWKTFINDELEFGIIESSKTLCNKVKRSRKIIARHFTMPRNQIENLTNLWENKFIKKRRISFFFEMSFYHLLVKFVLEMLEWQVCWEWHHRMDDGGWLTIRITKCREWLVEVNDAHNQLKGLDDSNKDSDGKINTLSFLHFCCCYCCLVVGTF